MTLVRETAVRLELKDITGWQIHHSTSEHPPIM